jgi:phospholipid transport system substrate-binding protein
MKRFLPILSVLAFALFGIPEGHAQAPATAAESANAISPAEVAKAEAFIKTKHNRVRAVLRKPDTPKRGQELTELLGEFLDYQRLAELSLAAEWDKRSQKQLDHFVSLLRQLVERQYQRNMESTLDYKVRWVGTEAIDEGVKVKSSARSISKKRQPPITIDYSMSPSGKEWKVFDIFTDDVSLVRNYKRQFRRVIKEEGWNGLIDRMEKKLAAEDELI